MRKLLLAAFSAGLLVLACPNVAFALELFVPDAVLDLRVTTEEAPTTLTAHWTPAATGTPADHYVLWVHDGTDYAGQAVCFEASCSSAHLTGLLPGRTYRAVVYAANNLGLSLPSWSSPIDVVSGCANGVELCAEVDADTDAGAARSIAQGFLHSANEPLPDEDAELLAPKWWRTWIGSGPGYLPYDTAAASGAEVIVVLSDAWNEATYSELRGGALPPWEDWSRYRTWVRDHVQAVLDSGRRPAYWDVQNEPGQGYFGPLDALSWTTEHMLEQFLVAYEEIKALDPAAKVIGPSTGAFLPVARPGFQILDLAAFLDFAEAHGLVLDAIAWHELWTATSDTSVLPQAIEDHVAEARRMIAARNVGDPEILITEWGTPENHRIPGWSVGSMAAMERAGVTAALRSCWPSPDEPTNECDTQSVDGLYSGDGTSRYGTYWVHRRYAEMTGRKLATSTSSARVSVFATRESDEALRLLVGRHEQCTARIISGCFTYYPVDPLSAEPQPAPVAIAVKPQTGVTSYRVQVERIPGDGASLDAPIVESDEVVTVDGEHVTVMLPGVGDGDAFSVTLTPVAPPPADDPPVDEPPADDPPADETPTAFHALTPTRLLDTRDGDVPVGAESVVSVPITGRAGIPSAGVAAAVVNLTVTEPTSSGYLTAFPSGGALPNTSSLNFVARQTVANGVIVPVGPDGSISVFNKRGSAHVIVDVMGWLANGEAYNPITPTRLLDTRDEGVPVTGGSAINVPITGRSGIPSSGVAAAVVNLTVTGPSDSGFLTAFPSGGSVPDTSSVNFVAGQTVANGVIVPVGPDGSISVYNKRGSAHVVVDVMGWLANGDTYAAVSPTRLLDTRTDAGPVMGGSVITIPIAGRAGIPATGVAAAVVNLTVTGPSESGYLTAFPTGGAFPDTSSLNFVAGRTVANGVIVPVGPDGSISVFNKRGAAHVVVDVMGWLA